MFAIARPSTRHLVGLLAAALLPVAGFGQGAAPNPLFAADAPVELTLTFPLRRVVARASSRPEVDGTVSYAGPSGAVSLDVKVTTRGNSRLEVCAFPPLWVDFRRSEVPGTLFAGQNRIKLVTQCRNGAAFADYLELEYLIYRFYQHISDVAFLVRPAAMRYVDSERSREQSAPAFFLEHKDDLAARTGLQVADVPRLGVGDQDPSALARLSLFQYVIANTDWSALESPQGDDDCCHNGVVFVTSAGQYVVVPYDFDQSGLISTSYASPAAGLGIRTVRQRLYRGYCATNAYLDDAVAALNAARAPFEALLNAAPLTDRKRADALGFLEESYAIINDPARRQREIVDRCR